MGRHSRRLAVRVSGATAGFLGIWAAYHRWQLSGAAVISLSEEVIMARPQPRSVKLHQIERSSVDKPFDVLIIGGGVTGLYTAVDAAQRGLRVALVEADDFGSGYSGSCPSLLPGAFPYVQRALRQRDLLWLRRGLEAWQALTVWANVAPRIVQSPVSTLIPSSHFSELLELSITALLTTLLSPFCGPWKPFRFVRGAVLREEFHAMEDNVKGGVVTQDAVLDGAAASIALARTAEALGALPLNYALVKAIAAVESKPPSVTGANFTVTIDDVGGTVPRGFEVHTRSIVNCAGPWVDEVRKMLPSSASSADQVSLTRHQEYTYLVVPRSAVNVCEGKTGGVFLQIGAILASSTSYSFSSVMMLPWFDQTVLIGPSVSPLRHLPSRAAAMPFAATAQNGLRRQEDNDSSRSKLQRQHICQALGASGVKVDEKRILSSLSFVVPVFNTSSDAQWAANLFMKGFHITAWTQEPHIVHVYGGSLSFARDIAENAVDRLLHDIGTFVEGELRLLQPCRTRRLALVGTELKEDSDRDVLSPAARIQRLVREEYATRVVDVLARRTHAAYSSPAEALKAIPAIAEVMRNELGWSAEKKQLEMDVALAFMHDIAVP